jgi:hypothetical protein
MTREPLKPGDFIEIRCTDSGLTFVGFVTRATSKRVTARWERREGPEGLTRPSVIDPNRFEIVGLLFSGQRAGRLAGLLADEILADEEDASASQGREPSALAEASS